MILICYLISEFPVHAFMRPALFCVICYLQCLIWSARGRLCSLFFPDEPAIATAVGLFFALVTVFFSGIVIPLHQLDPILKPLIGISDIKYEVSSLMTTVYGNDRCSGGQVTSFFIRDIMRQASITSVTTVVSPTFNFTEDDENKLAQIASLHPNDASVLQKALNDYYASYEPTSSGLGFQPSFMLDIYRIQENDMAYNFVYLSLMYVVASMFVYLSLRVRTIPKRL